MTIKPDNTTPYVLRNENDEAAALEDGHLNRQSIITLMVLVVLLITTTFIFVPAQKAKPEAFIQTGNHPSCVNWQTSANLETGNGNGLRAISVLSKDDVWVVGSLRMAAGAFMLNGSRALIQHWNGTVWSTSILPTTSEGRNFYLRGVAAVSSSDVWVAGESYASETPDGHTLIAHWDGIHWSVVESPNPSHINNNLNSIAGVNTNNIWAVGSYEDSNHVSRTLILHWDGANWKTWPSNIVSTRGELFGVTAISEDEAWAVGYQMDDQNVKLLVLRWNGSNWQSVPISLNATTPILHHITSVGKNDMWAVGSSEEGGVILHWDGIVWSIVSNPSASSSGTSLNGVAGVNKDDVWAVGYNQNSNQSVTLYWNGKKWSEVISPQSMLGGGLFDIANDAEHGVWVVGHSFSNQSGSYYALVSHFTGTPCP